MLFLHGNTPKSMPPNDFLQRKLRDGKNRIEYIRDIFLYSSFPSCTREEVNQNASLSIKDENRLFQAERWMH